MTSPFDLPNLFGSNTVFDPIDQLLLSGEAQTAAEAEEMYLNNNLPEIYRLLASPLSNEELAQHPLIRLLYFRGSRGWEDSL